MYDVIHAEAFYMLRQMIMTNHCFC